VPEARTPGHSDIGPAGNSVDIEGGFVGLIGGRFTELSGDRTRLTVPITAALLQPQGIVHGGVYCGIVETLASIAGALWLGDRGNVVGVNNNTNFIRATRAGTLHGEALPIHRGRTQQLWQVVITDDEERVVARGEVRLAHIASTDRLASSQLANS
jgi:uncharacterized protein (TIGR00369 family)